MVLLVWESRHPSLGLVSCRIGSSLHSMSGGAICVNEMLCLSRGPDGTLNQHKGTNLEVVGSGHFQPHKSS